ncbi:NACHT, LRR and PYD domains-containing protein 4C-like isoform X2 [Styela clava]
MSYQKVIAKINENTYKCTDFYDFAEPFEVFEKKLNVDVTPLLEEIDFYKGGRITKYEYVPKSSGFQENSEEERERTPGYDYGSESSEFQDDSEEEREKTPEYDYVPESSKFQKKMEKERKRGIRKKTQLDELFNNFKQGHICFVGPAGSGKSTLMKASSRNAMHGKYFQGTIKMVQYIQCKQFMNNSKVTAGELIFNNLPKEERGQAIDYAKTHPEEVLFMLDSLDTLQYTVDGVYEIISLDELAYPEVIVWNFLTGKLFPGCRISSSSREHSIRNYWGEVRPDKVIALAGLAKESITEIISGYEGDEEAEKIMEFLKIKAPLHLLLCTTPVMLVYTLIALKFEPNFKPTTMTGIMTVVMQSILRSPHTHQENIMEVLGKLKELSYIGTVDCRVLFTENDFHQVDLKPEEATDLAILAPGGIYRKLFQGIHLLYFQHQSLQEMLTSFYILGLDLKSFDQFVDTDLHTDHFVLIRKMMCGLLLNPTVYEAARVLLEDIKDLKEKRDILKKSLQSQLGKPRKVSLSSKSDLLELLTALNEAKDGMSDLVKSSLDEIHMSQLPLSKSDFHVIGSVASYCTSLSMDFAYCDLKSASLQTLASELKGSNVKIKDLQLEGNENMGVEGLSSVGQILSNQSCVELLDLESCNLSSDQLQAFKSSFGNNTEIRHLQLNGNENMGVEGLSSVGQILSNQSCVGGLSLHNCNLSSDQLQAFKSSLGNNTEIRNLQLDGNENMGVEGLSSVGQILSNQSCVERLLLDNCNLSSDQLQAFKLSLGINTEIKRLWLGGNTSMGVEGLSSVGQVLSNQSCVEHLDLNRCKLSSDQLQAFKFSLGNNTEIEHLDLQEERIANHEDIVAIANLLPNVTKKLWLYGWKIAVEDEKILQNQLNEIGSEKLKIKLGGRRRKTLKSQRKPADKAINVTLKQNPTLSSESEFGATSQISNSESTEENMEISKEAKSPSELLMTEKEAEQSDKEVTEQAAKLTQPGGTSSRTTDGKRRRTSDEDSGPRSKIAPSDVEEIQQEDKLSRYYLSQIENVSSQRSGSDILLTWNEVPDSNVLYNVEILCDDVKLGETHTTEVSQYRMKSPILGKRYRFQVWAKDEWGNSCIKTQSKNVIKVENVEVAGGSMRLNECKVTFPGGTFNKQTKVWMSVEIDNSICPEEYIGITPAFDISADSEFLRDAIVQIQSWCVGLEKDKIDILHFSSKTDWDNINPDRITENNSIEFRCRRFSRVMAIIRWLLFGTVELLMEHRLYILNNNQFHFAFFTSSETVQNLVRHYYKDLGAQLAPIHLPQILLQTGDNIRIRLQIDCGPENIHFDFPDGHTFLADKKFMTKQRNEYMFRLLPPLGEYPQRNIRYEMVKEGDEPEFCNRDFNFPLKPKERRGPPPIHLVDRRVITPINLAGANVGNVHLPDRGNQNNQQIGQNEQEEAGAVGGNQAIEPQQNEPLQQHEGDDDSDDLG